MDKNINNFLNYTKVSSTRYRQQFFLFHVFGIYLWSAKPPPNILSYIWLYIYFFGFRNGSIFCE